MTPPVETRSGSPVPARPLERRQSVQSADTAMAVLKRLADVGGSATLTALAQGVGDSPAKVHRYLVSLVRAGMVEQDAESQRYRLGPEVIRMGLAAMRLSDPVRLAEPALVRLRETLDVTCFVAVMGNRGPTILRIEEPGLPVTVNVRAGSVLSMLWSATGRVFLALLDDAPTRALADQELASVPADRRPAIEGARGLEALCAGIREQGLAVVRDTYLPGISAVAVPLFDFTGRACAVLTALGASGGFDASADGLVAQALREEARGTSLRLGHRPPEDPSRAGPRDRQPATP
jgi:DNA-binding IclR family transcriptional regulator